jgi:hypothetical protein
MANFDIEGFPRHHRVLHVKQEVKSSAQSVLEVAAGGPGAHWPLVIGLAVVPLAVVEGSKLVASCVRWAGAYRGAESRRSSQS